MSDSQIFLLSAVIALFTSVLASTMQSLNQSRLWRKDRRFEAYIQTINGFESLRGFYLEIIIRDVGLSSTAAQPESNIEANDAIHPRLYLVAPSHICRLVAFGEDVYTLLNNHVEKVKKEVPKGTWKDEIINYDSYKSYQEFSEVARNFNTIVSMAMSADLGFHPLKKAWIIFRARLMVTRVRRRIGELE